MRQTCNIVPIAIAALIAFGTPGATLAQAPQAPATAGTAAAPAAAAAVPIPPPAPPALTAKDLDGAEIFASDAKAIGKVKKVNSSGGKLQNVEVQSGGYWGYFATTYVVPADKLAKKGGRIELSMTSEQAKSLKK